MEKRRALVVDDDRDVVEPLSDCLELFGYRVVSAYSVAEARAALAASPVDVLICDWDVAGESGALVLQDAELRYPKAVRLLLTGSVAAEWSHAVQNGLIHAALIKPFEVAGLKRLLESLSTSAG
jgi:DNA-binding NtrC family response regulator